MADQQKELMEAEDGRRSVEQACSVAFTAYTDVKVQYMVVGPDPYLQTVETRKLVRAVQWTLARVTYEEYPDRSDYTFIIDAMWELGAGRSDSYYWREAAKRIPDIEMYLFTLGRLPSRPKW